MFATIGLVVDLILILALVLFAILGYKKGLFKTILSLFNWTVCLLVAIFGAKYIAGWINGIYDFAGLIGGKISNGLIKSNSLFETSLSAFGSKDAVVSAIQSNPQGTNGFTRKLIEVIFANSTIDYSSSQSLGVTIGQKMGGIVMVLIAGILIFVVLKIILALLTKLLNKAGETRVIGKLNKILGAVVGVAKASLIVIVLNVVLVFMSAIPFVGNTITPLVNNNTYVERAIYNKTDEIIKDKVINGDFVDKYISNLWKKG